MLREVLVGSVSLALPGVLGGTVGAQPDDAGATGTFKPAGSLADSRFDHTATTLSDGRVLVVGGRGDGVDDLASAEVWDPATGSFGPTGSLGAARYSHTATLLPDGRVLVVGGWGDDDALTAAEVWDPGTGSFGPAGSLAEGRGQHTATALPDGRVLIVGGIARKPKSVVAAEVWDPATASFGPAGSSTEARALHGAALLPDGRVLVVGGAGIAAGTLAPLRSAEVWDPEAGTFDPAGSLAEARLWLVATALPDGRVLVVGGKSNDSAAAEVWEAAE